MGLEYGVQLTRQQQNIAPPRRGPAGARRAARGSLGRRGAVAVDDAESCLDDAAMADEEQEFQIEGVRKLDGEHSGGQGGMMDEHNMRDHLEAFAKKREDPERAASVQKLCARLREGGEESALRTALELFPDVTDAWAALADALGQFTAEPSTQRRIREAMNALARDEGTAVRAGMYAVEQAAAFRELGGPAELRDMYRGAVCEFTDVKEVCAWLMRRCGHDFARGMDYLFRTLGADMAADMPSMDRAHLESVNRSLGRVRLFHSAYLLCADMLERCARVLNIVPLGTFTPLDCAAQVVALRDERFLGPLQIDELAAHMRLDGIEPRILFLQELLRTTRNFPPLLFDGEEGRAKVLDAVQQSVDAAVRREDEALAAGG